MIFYIIVIVAAAVLLTNMTRKKQKGIEDGQQPAFAMGSLTKEQRTLVKEQYKVYRRKIFEENPRAARFDKRKKGWITFLIVLRLFLLVVVTCTQVNVSEGPLVLLIMGMLLGVFPSLIILLVAMAPKWQFACMLYLLAAQQILNFINSMAEIGIQSLGDFLWSVSEGFKMNPFLIILDMISWSYVLFLLLTAVCLTLIPGNRELAQQSEELYDRMKDFRPEL